MTTPKQAKRNKAYARRVRFDYGGRKAFGAGSATKQTHAFGVLAFCPSRGLRNGRPIQ
jgi:hypothetical protein